MVPYVIVLKLFFNHIRRISMGNKPVMYEWPESQICMDCPHGEFVMSDKLVNSNYLGMNGCDKNDGVGCPKLDLKRSKVKSVEVAGTKINNDDEFECSLYITLHDGKVYNLDVKSMMRTEHWLQGDE
jgi:hypothetical protein